LLTMHRLIYICMYICMHVCMHVRLYVCTHAHTHTHIHTHPHTPTHTHTNTQVLVDLKTALDARQAPGVCSDASLKEKEQLCDKLGAAACKRARAEEKASSKSAADKAGAAGAGEGNLGEDSMRITVHCGDSHWNSELVTLDVMASDTIQTVKGKIRSNYAKIRRLPRGIKLFVSTKNSTAHVCEHPVQDHLTLAACNVENLGQIWVFRAWVCWGTLCVCCDTLLHYAYRAYHKSHIA
jgi:hypothetical protein